MGDKVKGLRDQSGLLTAYVFWCPGCRDAHPYRVARGAEEDPECPVWTFNGDRERPSFSPSLLVNKDHPSRCHLYLTDGQLHFCADSHHELKGQTVPCPDWDDERW